MNSNEIIEHLDQITNLWNQESQVTVLINELSKYFPKINSHLGIVLNDDSDFRQETISALNSNFSDLVPYLQQLKIGKIFIELDLLIQEYNKLRKVFKNKSNPIARITLRLRVFYRALEKTFGKYTPSNILPLVKLASDIQITVRVISEFAGSFKAMLLDEPKLDEDKKDISLFFDSTISYREVINKLIAIEAIYDELCRLLNVSTSQYPLELMKLEVGSWWVKLFGESKVIALATSLIEKSVFYLHRNYTQEGKIRTIPKNAEVINSLLDLSKSLKANGVDTKVLDENLEHSAIVLSNQLNDLLVGEPNVKVNDNKFYIGAELDQKLLDERKALQLTDGNDKEYKDG